MVVQWHSSCLTENIDSVIFLGHEWKHHRMDARNLTRSWRFSESGRHRSIHSEFNRTIIGLKLLNGIEKTHWATSSAFEHILFFFTSFHSVISLCPSFHPLDDPFVAWSRWVAIDIEIYYRKCHMLPWHISVLHDWCIVHFSSWCSFSTSLHLNRIEQEVAHVQQWTT